MHKTHDALLFPLQQATAQPAAAAKTRLWGHCHKSTLQSHGMAHADVTLQELSRVALRQRQLREQQCAHINSIKIHNQWRKIMRLSKVEELKGQVEVLSQDHERQVDRKDALVQVRDWLRARECRKAERGLQQGAMEWARV